MNLYKISVRWRADVDGDTTYDTVYVAAPNHGSAIAVAEEWCAREHKMIVNMSVEQVDDPYLVHRV